MENFPYYGYGYFTSKYETVPNIPLTYYSFRIMVGLGGAFPPTLPDSDVVCLQA